MTNIPRHHVVIRLLDRLLPSDESMSISTRHGHRLLVAILLGLIFYLAGLLLVSHCCLPLEPAGLHLVTVFSLTTIAGLGVSLWLFRATGLRSPAVNCVFLTLMVAGAYISANLGGIYSPSNANLLIIPTLAILFLGIRTGIFWSTMLVATWLGLFVADRSGIVFTNVMLERNTSMGIFAALVTGAVGITLVLIYYEYCNQQLRQLLEREHRQYEHLANHDQLTGLPNRRFFIETINNRIREAAGDDEQFTILFFDLNRFKQANDLFDHQFGDEVLKLTAERLLDNTRAGDVVARWGGDEFAMLLSNIKDKAGIEETIERMAGVIAEPMKIRDQEYRISASTGYSIFPEHGRTTESLITFADRAMYYQKGKSVDRRWKRPGTDPAIAQQ